MKRFFRLSGLVLAVALLPLAASAGPFEPTTGSVSERRLSVAGEVVRVDRFDSTLQVEGVELVVPRGIADLAELEPGTRVAAWYELRGGSAVVTELEIFEPAR